jgi:hypothetical protein
MCERWNGHHEQHYKSWDLIFGRVNKNGESASDLLEETEAGMIAFNELGQLGRSNFPARLGAAGLGGVEGESSPSLSARYAKRPARGVLRIWRREVVDEPMFDNFVWNKIGQPQAGPEARSA